MERLGAKATAMIGALQQRGLSHGRAHHHGLGEEPQALQREQDHRGEHRQLTQRRLAGIAVGEARLKVL
jgi:hypothetical protein